MTFRPKIWFPIAALLSVVNVAAVWFAAAPAEPFHATTHAALGVAFGLWAQRLWQRRQQEGGSEFDDKLQPLELEVDQIRQQLVETQERLDFAERILAQVPERRPPDRND